MSNVNLGSTPLIGKINKIGMVLAAIGALGLGATLYLNGQERFFADYLLGFWYFAGISVTMMFFSALQFLARAGWSSAVRRIAENFTGMVPFMAIALIPIVINMLSHNSIYEWSHHDAANDPILQKKAAYLNPTAFMIRMGVYCLFWFGMFRFVIGNSIKQDASATDITPTRKNWKRAAPWVLVYALSITFASFDLLMSLEPHWFSTIWGVYTFAGHFVGALAIVTIMTVALYNNGHLREYITAEHFHDLGKLMFAFSVFWAYIAFSQYFIIWYANLPEETIYFATRTTHGWEFFGIALVLMHFVVPFMVLLRQDVKRKTNVLVAASIIILISHYIDLTWIIMPAVGHHILKIEGVLFGWQELTGWLFFAGLFMILAARNYQKRNAVAINDPLIYEATEYYS
ncbi:MAG: hypothetical protein IPH49_01060 [Ignavibacteria bacterium]|nr:hypothetical protein [Ignavibacteria bacterium]